MEPAIRSTSLLFASALVLCLATGRTRAQCPEGMMTSFERIGSVAIKDSALSVLYTTLNMSSNSLDSPAASTIASIPITAECNNRCRKNGRCRAYLVDYARHTCYQVEAAPGTYLHPSQQHSGGGLVRAPPPIHLVPTQERTSYFERVCLSLPPFAGCERAWAYERVLGHQIQGHDDKLVEDVPSRLKCQQLCLNETEFRCRSGEYDYFTMQCRLSMSDRHLRPAAFRPTAPSVDYFENQCAPVGQQCDAFDRYEDLDLGRAEISRDASSPDQCQQHCTGTKAFVCRSFTWDPTLGKCYLNSANTNMVGGLDRLIGAPGLTYYQRNDCVDLKLECDTSAMTLQLRTSEPFRGRMYVRDEPNSCEVMGRSSLQSSLSIPFHQSHARCAVREPPNRYSSVVVVQQHPMIQRKSDRYIKVVCDFQTSNKTIHSSYNVVANPWTSTALINATSSAPKIRLRITDKFGVDITGAKLGDELYLRIEAETESVYDMVARSVLAKSGQTDESIMLIDKDGCPTDFRIFPSLRKLNRRTIVGKFDAFKFSSDVVVRFQVDVQFCLNQCPSSSCDGNLLLNTNAAQLDGDMFSSGADLESSSSPAPPQLMSSTVGPMRSGEFSTKMTQSPSSGGRLSTAADHQMMQSTAANQQAIDSPYLQSSTLPTLPPPQFHSSLQTPLRASHNQHLGPSGNSNNNNNLDDHHLRPAGSHQLQQQQQAMNGSSSNSYLATTMSHLNPLPVPSVEPPYQSRGPALADNFYYSAGTSGQQQQPSLPANAPQHLTVHQLHLLNNGNSNSSSYGNNRQPVDMLMQPTNDPQTFEQQLQPQRGNNNNNMMQSLNMMTQQNMGHEQKSLDGGSSGFGKSRSGHQPGSLPAATSGGSQDSGSGRQQQQRRRRRSAEPMPQAPRHVPLQREIIVESAPTSGSGDRQSNAKGAHNPATATPRGGKVAGGGRRDPKSETRADGLSRSQSEGPSYEAKSNGNKFESLNNLAPDSSSSRSSHSAEGDQQVDNPQLLCTTRHSLVIASMAFCTIQLLTIALCLVTWMHKRDTTTTKFKVKHPIGERLY